MNAIEKYLLNKKYGFYIIGWLIFIYLIYKDTFNVKSTIFTIAMIINIFSIIYLAVELAKHKIAIATNNIFLPLLLIITITLSLAIAYFDNPKTLIYVYTVSPFLGVFAFIGVINSHRRKSPIK